MAAKSTPIRGTRYKALTGISGHDVVDWDLLGAVMVTKMLEQVRSIQEVDLKYGEDASYMGKKKQTEWMRDYEKHDVVVFKKKNSSSSHLNFLGRGVIDKPLKEVAAFLRRVENNLSWDKFLIEASNLIVLSETEYEASYIGYQRFETKKCLVNTRRDMMIFMKCVFQGGRYIQTAVSIEDPEHPCPPGLKRIEVGVGSGWVLENYGLSNSRTLLTYISNSTDLNGLPTFVTNLVLKRQPLAIYYVRRQLMVVGVDGGRPRQSSEQSYSDEEDFLILESLELPDDFVPVSSGDREDQFYEQEVPVEHFVRNVS